MVSPRATLNKRRFTPAVFLLAVSVFPIYGADNAGGEAPKKVRRIKAIRILSRSEVRAAGNFREIPLADAMEAPLSQRVTDVLQKQTGIQVNRAGAPGTQSLLGIRGSSPEQVEYFLEGMPLPKPYNAPLNLETLPLPLFRSVEIYPSFIPSHLPASNLGGAMNFNLRDSGPNETNYLTQAVADSLVGSSLAFARQTHGSLNYVNFEQSRNIYTYVNSNGTRDNSSDDTTQLRRNEDFSRLGYTGFARFQLSSWKFSTLVDFNHTDRGLPGVENQPLNHVRKTDDRISGSISAKYRVTDTQQFIGFTSLTLDRSAIYDPKRELLFSTLQSSNSPQATGGLTYAFRTQQFDAALHARGKYQTVVLNDSRLAERGEGQLTASAAMDIDIVRFAVQASGTASQDTAAANAFFASQAKNFAAQGIGGSALAAIRPLYLFTNDTKNQEGNQLLEIYTQASSAYRPPSLYERFGDNVFVTPSDNLRNERAVTNAAGIKGSFSCGFALVCSLRSEGWLTGAQDYILFTQNSARTLVAVNASSAQIWGIENEALINWPGHLLLSLRYTYLNAHDYSNIPYYQDKYLPMRPRHHATGTFTVFLGSWRLLSAVEYRGAVFRDRYNSYGYFLASKFTADLGIDYVIDSHARHMLSVAVKNLTDNQKVDIIGYTVPGRYFVAKWTAQF
jgi:hypothetical protein